MEHTEWLQFEIKAWGSGFWWIWGMNEEWMSSDCKKNKSSGNLHANLTFCVCEMGFSALKNIKTGKSNDGWKKYESEIVYTAVYQYTKIM